MLQEADLLPVRNAPAEPLPDRTWPCPELECRFHKLFAGEMLFDHGEYSDIM
jgi:hypothetical protein